MKRLLSILVFILVFSNLSAIVPTRVILATDENANYIEFWPVVAELWKEIGIKPTLALIGDKKVDESLGDVIRFPKIQGVPSSLQAQTIRLLLPVLFENDVCIISDIDMLPISRTYFLNSATQCPANSFVIYRDKAYSYWNWKAYPMCYFAAKGSIFREVFGIRKKEDINRLIGEWFHRDLGWNTDEMLLYEYVNNWNQRGGNLIKLGHDVVLRLDRLNWVPEEVDYSKFIDAHCPRPYSGYKYTIDVAVKNIKEHLKKH